MFRFVAGRRCRRYRRVWTWLRWRAMTCTLLPCLLYTVYIQLSSARPGSSIRHSGSDTLLPVSPLDDWFEIASHTNVTWDPDPAARMRHRQEVLTRYCNTHWGDDTDGGGGPPAYRGNSLVTRRHSVLFCPVGKAASTLLTRFLVAAVQTTKIISPYQITIEKAMRMRGIRTGKMAVFSALYQLLPKGVSPEDKVLSNIQQRVLFVRCPFQRLWSAYVDKLLSPNPYYWETWGAAAVNVSQKALESTAVLHPSQVLRQQPRANYQGPCGRTPNVTFSEFLQLVVKGLHRTDPHVRPVSWECSPCRVRFNIIGHVETLVDDVTHLADLMDLRGRNATLRRLDWKEEMARDAFKDAARSVFVEWAPRIARCGLTREEAAQRLWRVFQVRGFVGMEEGFPSLLSKDHDYSRGQKAPPLLDAAMMENALFKAHAKSVKRRGKKRLDDQRRAAFFLAYSEVSAKLKESIRNIYKSDFEMFGFDLLPQL